MNSTNTLIKSVSSWFSSVTSTDETKKIVDWTTVCNENSQWNCTNSLYFRLPLEIHELITCNLTAEDILSSALVCKAWWNVTKQEQLWRHLFQRDSPSWHLLCRNEAHLASSSNNKWRTAYLCQYRLNKSRFAPSQVAAKLSLFAESVAGVGQWELRLPFARKVHRILMFGEGLETSARKLLYTLLWSKNSPFQMTRAYPGVEGVGSGFGFRVGSKELALAALYKYDTPGVFDRVRPQWRELFLSTSGFVFVVDPNEELARARADLASFMDAEWIPPSAPLLVLVIHRASDATRSSPGATPVAVAEALQLNERRSKNFLVRYCAWPDGLHGVVDGISWLSENL